MSDNLGTHTEQWAHLLSSLSGCLDASGKCINPAVFSQGLEGYLREHSGASVPDILQQLSEGLRVPNSPGIETTLSDAHESVAEILKGDAESPLSLSKRINRATTLQECFSEEVVRVAEDLKRNAGMLVNVYTTAGYKTCIQGKRLQSGPLGAIKTMRDARRGGNITSHLLSTGVNVRIMTDKKSPTIPGFEVISLDFIGQGGVPKDDYGRGITNPRGIIFIFQENYDESIRKHIAQDPQFALEILLYLEPAFFYTHTKNEDARFLSGKLDVLVTDTNNPIGGSEQIKSHMTVPNKDEADKLNDLGGNKSYLYSRDEVW